MFVYLFQGVLLGTGTSSLMLSLLPGKVLKVRHVPVQHRMLEPADCLCS